MTLSLVGDGSGRFRPPHKSQAKADAQRLPQADLPAPEPPTEVPPEVRARSCAPEPETAPTWHEGERLSPTLCPGYWPTLAIGCYRWGRRPFYGNDWTEWQADQPESN